MFTKQLLFRLVVKVAKVPLSHTLFEFKLIMIIKMIDLMTGLEYPLDSRPTPKLVPDESPPQLANLLIMIIRKECDDDAYGRLLPKMEPVWQNGDWRGQ